MQEESRRASLGYLSEALNFEHGSTSTSSNGLIIDHHWENNIHSIGDNDLHDYMIANSEASTHNEQGRNEIIDLDSDSEQPSDTNQHVENVNLNAEYIEVDSDGAGSSVEGRREACKRKALESSSIGQSSSGGFHHGESSSSSSWTPASVNVLNISGPRRQFSGSSAMAESSIRNTSLRSNLSDQQETVSRVVPEDQQQHMSELRLGQSLGNVFTQNSNPPAISIPPPVSRNMLPPPFQWTEVVSLAGGSSSPVERNLHLDETRSRSIPENPLFTAPPPQLRSSRSATSGNLNTAGVVQPPPSYLAYQNSLQQQRRRSELARRSLISSTNQRGSPPPPPPGGLMLQPGGDRQGDSVAGGAHQSSRALATASRGRSRLTVSQMQNILDVMRRDPNHNLRLEDVMLINQSLLLDEASGIMHDRYRDMRLDVDNMSYEELLALEERIGDVCTGVNEETITNRLKQKKYKSSTKSPEEAEPSCCICQEEYSEGEEMGTLECGHDFHSQCVKEWLKQKNLCPICKTTGLNTAKKRKLG